MARKDDGVRILPLLERVQEADQTLTARFAMDEERFPYQPGDAADVTVLKPIHRGKDLVHTFTLSSSPTEKGFVQITTRMRDSTFKRNLKDVPLGHEFQFGEAGGDFRLPRDTKRPLVFIAGGIGVTPFRSMLKFMVDRGRRQEVILMVANRAPAAAAFVDQFDAWARKLPLTVVSTVTGGHGPDWKGETGRIDQKMIRRHVPQKTLAKATFYVAGPPSMVKAIAGTVRSMGVDKEHLVTDEFAGYP